MGKIEVKKFGKVAVLYGGKSAEREVSLNSGQAVLAALLRQGVDAHAVDVGDDVIMQLQQGKFNCAFNALHGRGGEDGTIQGVLEWLGIAYSGSGVTASAITMNKIYSKQIWQHIELPTLPFTILNADNLVTMEHTTFPVCVKPACEGSSNGVSRVENFAQLLPAYEHALQYDAAVLLEPWINGREFTVAILAGEALPVVEICPPPGAFYDYKAKYLSHDTVYDCPCDLPMQQQAYLRDMALKSFYAIGCKGWGRVDFLQDKQGKFWLAEVNTVPGMTTTSLVPKASLAHGISFDDLVLRILSTAIE